MAVNDSGQVGVLFYDFRNDVLGDAPLSADVWLSVFDAQLNFIEEHRLTTDSMDFRQSVITGGRGYFPGDYVGLDTAGDDFVAAFTRNKQPGPSGRFSTASRGSVRGCQQPDEHRVCAGDALTVRCRKHLEGRAAPLQSRNIVNL